MSFWYWEGVKVLWPPNLQWLGGRARKPRQHGSRQSPHMASEDFELGQVVEDEMQKSTKSIGDPAVQKISSQ